MSDLWMMNYRAVFESHHKSLSPTEVKDALSYYGSIEEFPYHGVHHPLVVLNQAFKLYGETKHQWKLNWRIIEAACLLHDAGYKVGYNQNEEVAAYEITPIVLKNGWPPDQIEHVQKIIMETKFHDPDPNDLAACLVSDADMAVFYQPWETFVEEDKALRAEYLNAGVNKEILETGRRIFLESTLEKAKARELFHFPLSRGSRHQFAVENLTKLLESI